ncbi:MAG TPA: TfoX/Sxy family protein [Burkholderiaceae bacterium]|nr:TfoX/Sxy family protein [Burkholderiaceae bacterium]
MSEFVDYVLDLMGSWGEVRARRMFGGYGLYHGGRMFALVMDDTLYLKADDSTIERLVAARSAPFVYEGGGRRIELSYWRAPEACLDDAATMKEWCSIAWMAAQSGQRAARPSLPRCGAAKSGANVRARKPRSP